MKKITLIFLVACLTGGAGNSGYSGESGGRDYSFKNLSFYYFKTRFVPGESELKFLSSHIPDEMAFRLFDIDMKNDRPVPVSPLVLSQDASGFLNKNRVNTTGVIFITNRTFKNLPDETVNDLAGKVVLKINSLSKKNQMEFKEIQIDCDWTKSTKSIYFRFLLKMKELLKENNIRLSATIRLHQIKYREQTGVPPVDEGILMFYNMTPPVKWETKNSILDLDTARNYLGRLKDYPLDLSIALPLYSQAVLFNAGKCSGILSGNFLKQLSKKECFSRVSENRYRAKKRCLLEESSVTKEIPEGTVIRYEYVEPGELLNSLKALLDLRKDIKRVFIYEYSRAVFIKAPLNLLDPRDKSYLDTDVENFQYDKNNLEALTEISRIFSGYLFRNIH